MATMDVDSTTAPSPQFAKDFAYQADQRVEVASFLTKLYNVDHVREIDANPLKAFKRVVDHAERRVVQLEVTWPHQSLTDWDREHPKGVVATLGKNATLLKTGGVDRSIIEHELCRTDGGVFLSAITVRAIDNPTPATIGLDSNAIPVTEANRYLRSIGHLMHIEPHRRDERMRYSLLRVASGFVNDHRLVNTYGSTRPDQLWNGILRLPERKGFETRWCLVPRRHVIYEGIVHTPDWRQACSPLTLSKSTVESVPAFLLAPEPLIEQCIEQAVANYYPMMYHPPLGTLYFSLHPFGTSQFSRPAEWGKTACDSVPERPMRMVIQLAYTVYPDSMPQSSDVVCTFEQAHGRVVDASQQQTIDRNMST